MLLLLSLVVLFERIGDLPIEVVVVVVVAEVNDDFLFNDVLTDLEDDDAIDLFDDDENTADIDITGAVGVTIYSEGNKYTLRGRYAVASLIKLSANTWLLSGNLVT